MVLLFAQMIDVGGDIRLDVKLVEGDLRVGVPLVRAQVVG
jgi:hypothetical protein